MILSSACINKLPFNRNANLTNLSFPSGSLQRDLNFAHTAIKHTGITYNLGSCTVVTPVYLLPQDTSEIQVLLSHRCLSFALHCLQKLVHRILYLSEKRCRVTEPFWSMLSIPEKTQYLHLQFTVQVLILSTQILAVVTKNQTLFFKVSLLQKITKHTRFTSEKQKRKEGRQQVERKFVLSGTEENY